MSVKDMLLPHEDRWLRKAGIDPDAIPDDLPLPSPQDNGDGASPGADPVGTSADGPHDYIEIYPSRAPARTVNSDLRCPRVRYFPANIVNGKPQCPKCGKGVRFFGYLADRREGCCVDPRCGYRVFQMKNVAAACVNKR